MPLLTWVSLLFWKASPISVPAVEVSAGEAIMSNVLVGKAIMSSAVVTVADLTNLEPVGAAISNEVVT